MLNWWEGIEKILLDRHLTYIGTYFQLLEPLKQYCAMIF